MEVKTLLSQKTVLKNSICIISVMKTSSCSARQMFLASIDYLQQKNEYFSSCEQMNCNVYASGHALHVLFITQCILYILFVFYLLATCSTFRTKIA